MMVQVQAKDVDIKLRIGQIVADREMSRTKLAEQMGISPAYLASVINSPDKSVSSRLLKAFASIDVDINWLLTGIGNMYTGDKSGETIESWKMQAKNAQSELDAVEDTVIKLEYYIEQLERLNRQ